MVTHYLSRNGIRVIDVASSASGALTVTVENSLGMPILAESLLLEMPRIRATLRTSDEVAITSASDENIREHRGQDRARAPEMALPGDGEETGRSRPFSQRLQSLKRAFWTYS
jgi:hypothetical protein